LARRNACGAEIKVDCEEANIQAISADVDPFDQQCGETLYVWRAVDHEGEVLESYVTKRRDRKAALKFLRKTMK